nr:hypothetical protein [Tanacetum cinerariifolium]
MILAPGDPILHGRLYHYHPNGPVHMMTARKRVRPFRVQQLAMRHSVDHSSPDSSSRHSFSDHSSPDLPSTSAGPSRKRRRSPMTSVALPHVSEALSPVRADLIPSPKRVRDIGYLADVEGAAEVTYETLGDLVQRFYDHTQAIPIHHVRVIEGVQREQGHRIVGVESAVTALTERVAELERDNRRLRGTASVESQRVDRLQRGLLWDKFQMILNGSNQLDKVLAYWRENLVLDIKEQEGENEGNEGNGNGENGGNENGGNEGNGNGGNGENGNHVINYGGFMPMARECTFQDFLKYKPHTFSGTEGIVRLTRWFKKMKIVFDISNCPPKYQVKYAMCTLQNSALTWWNSHKRTIGVDAAYAMKWARLIKLMTEVYYPRNEVQKIETELWNLTVKGNDLTAYT